jgi:hypothetical protein
MATLSKREVEEGSLPEIPQEPEMTAQPRALARASLTLPSPASLVPVTQRARAAGMVAARAAGQAAEILDRPGSLVHAQPPTFARAREQHHEAAARHSAPFVRGLRLAWGYLHLLLVKTVLNGLEWVTENPARFLVAVIIGAVVWLWS